MSNALKLFMALLFALFAAVSSAWAHDEPSKCESYLVPPTTIVTNWEQFKSLLGKFSRIKVLIMPSPDIQLQISNKHAFLNLPIINPNTVGRRQRILIRSSGKSLSTHENTAEDWNLFILRVTHDKRGTPTYDIISEIGDWLPDDPDNAAMHALNVYIATSLAPYFSTFTLQIPVFDHIDLQDKDEREPKRICFEKLRDQQRAGISEPETISDLKLPQVHFLCDHLPMKLIDIHIVGYKGKEHGVPSKFEEDGYLIELKFKLDSP